MTNPDHACSCGHAQSDHGPQAGGRHTAAAKQRIKDSLELVNISGGFAIDSDGTVRDLTEEERTRYSDAQRRVMASFIQQRDEIAAALADQADVV